MSHRRVSLGRIAIPCITGGVDGRLGDPGRGGALPEARPGLQGAPRAAPFLLPLPSPPSSHLGFLVGRATSLC